MKTLRYIASTLSLFIKVGCIFPMVISTEFRLGQYRDDDRQEDATHCMIMGWKTTLRNMILLISDSIILGWSKWCQGTLVTWQFKWGVAKSWNCRQFLCWWHDHCHSGLSLSPKSTKNHNFILENNIDTRWKRMYYLCNDVGCCWNTCSIFKFRRFRFFPNTRNAHETRGNIPDRTRSFEF